MQFVLYFMQFVRIVLKRKTDEDRGGYRDQFQKQMEQPAAIKSGNRIHFDYQEAGKDRDRDEQ